MQAESSEPVRIVHLVMNAYTHDARVERSAQVACRLPADVQVLAVADDRVAVYPTDQPGDVVRLRLLTRPWGRWRPVQVLKYIEFCLRAWFQVVRFRPRIIHAHDIYTLPVGWLGSVLTRATLIYDSHELWSDVGSTARWPAWMRWCLTRVETFLSRRADHTITVSDGIADLLQQRWRTRRPAVIRNIPEVPVADRVDQPGRLSLRKAAGLGPDEPVLLYLGAIVRDRGLVDLVEALPRLANPDAVVVLLGQGGLQQPLLELAERLGVRDRLKIVPPVAAEDVIAMAREATLGLAPIEAADTSKRLCLPNKLFEFLHAGLPVVVSDLPEMRRVVEQYDVGELVPERNPVALAAAIDRLLSQPERLARLRERALGAAKQLHWGQERLRLEQLYLRSLNRAA